MLHKYVEDDIETCYKYIKYYNGKNKFYFIGDARIQQVYTSFVRQLDSFYIPKTSGTSKNLTYTNKKLNLEIKFVWQPVIDDTLYSLVESLLQVSSEKPSFLVMGMATEYMKVNGSTKEAVLEGFKTNLTSLVDMINDVNYNEAQFMSTSSLRNKRAPVKSTIADKSKSFYL